MTHLDDDVAAAQSSQNARATEEVFVFPTSFAQQRLWFLDRLTPGSVVYNITKALRLTGALNVRALEQGINEVVRRHETLRTTFAIQNGESVQVISLTATVALPMVDLSGLAQEESTINVQRLITEQVCRVFDPSRGPLLRTTLIKLSPKEHILLLSMHHIITDGWSIPIFYRELSQFYDFFANGNGQPVADLPIQYADYAVWQRERIAGQQLEDQFTYWKQQLGDNLPVLDLPTDHPRPSIQTDHGSREFFLLSPALLAALRTLSQQEGVTLFMTLLAAFQTLLYRYTKQEDIVVGSPIANRNRAEIEGLIGFFVNTLVLRTDLSNNPSFRELLQRVRGVALGAYAHQDLPFDKLVEELNPARDLSRTPLFQVMLVLQNAPARTVEFPGLAAESVPVETETAMFDLTLEMTETPNGLKGVIEYNTDLFDATTIQRMIGHVQVLLEGIVADPQQTISELPLLADAERQQLLVEWNDTRWEYPHDKCIHQLFEEQVARTPDAVAAVFEEQHLTYRELNARANQLARYLRSRGVAPDQLVGICVERSLDMLVAIWGVLKAGGAYVPLDPAYPPQRLAWMLEDAQVRLVLTQRRLVSVMPESQAQLVCWDTEVDTFAQENDRNLDLGTRPDQLAYTIYTSGSTGKPKGVLISHHNLVYSTRARFAYYRERVSGLLLLPSISFDASVAGIFWTLCQGGTLFIPATGMEYDPAYLAGLIARHALSHLLGLPSVYALIVAQTAPHELRSLAVVIVGGEACPTALVAQHKAVLPAVSLFNEYGPTEATVWSTVYACESKADRVTVPIGRPIVNTQVYLLDEHLRPVPIGVPGELCIGGAGVARGYLNQPELTNERFIANPFRSGQRLYRTGDLARYLADGNLEYLGRCDDQVKIRGFRIELGEIEAILSQYPGVQMAVVTAHEDQLGNKRLYAYFVPIPGTSPSANELASFLKTKLPTYMLPTGYIALEAMPLAPSGKVDRRALPTPDQTHSESESKYVTPRTPEEEILAGIWTQVLGVARVGIHDNFFELGGDSILSIQVVSRANQAGLRLTPRQLFQFPTIAGLAAVARVLPTSQKRYEQGFVTGPLPLTPIQRWFFEQQLPEPHHWNQAVLLEMQARVSRSRLEGAVAQLLVHHDALRLRFEHDQSGWFAVNAGVEDKTPFEWIDLSGLNGAEQSQVLQAKVILVQASLNLVRGPLMRVVYFDLGAECPGRLLMVVHHLAVDGVSWRILLEDLYLAYEQLNSDEAGKLGIPINRLPPKTMSFRDWAQGLERYAQSKTILDELKYWLSVPKKQSVRLPKDYKDGQANTEASARTVTVFLSAEETGALLRDVPAAYGTEINDALLTALAQAFEQWTAACTLLIDLEGHGREDVIDDADISRTVGWFTAVFPVQLDLSSVEGAGEALKAVKEQLRQIPQRGIGYGLLRYLHKDRHIAAQLMALPQAEIIFNYLGQLDQTIKSSPFHFAHESVGPLHSLLGWRSHVFEVNSSVIGEQLQMRWTYSENLHRRETVEKLVAGFIESLRSLIKHCQSPEAGGYTPSDFPDVELSQADVEALEEELDAE
jgi:amino acid adenylation domain-containing protein/non-ribosomal peptide synthase protein (TIGR01720 family)